MSRSGTLPHPMRKNAAAREAWQGAKRRRNEARPRQVRVRIGEKDYLVRKA